MFSLGRGEYRTEQACQLFFVIVIENRVVQALPSKPIPASALAHNDKRSERADYICASAFNEQGTIILCRGGDKKHVDFATCIIYMHDGGYVNNCMLAIRLKQKLNAHI